MCLFDTNEDLTLYIVYDGRRFHYPATICHSRTRSRRVPEHCDTSWYTVHCWYALLHHKHVFGLTSVLERRNVKIINAPTGTQQNPYLLTEEEEKKTLRKHEEHKQQLRVPRRPAWTKSMTTAQLDRQEKDAFLEWRRGLAQCVH